MVASRPPATIATRLQSASASDRMCELKKTVVPRSRSSRINARMSRRPSGSSPDIGSSRKMTSGSLMQRLRDAYTLHHPLRVLAQLHPALGAKADAIEQPAGAGAAL